MLAQLANESPRTPETEEYRQILTRSTNHLLLPAHPEGDLRHRLNDLRDAWSNIDSSCTHLHEEEPKHREDYDPNHGTP